MEKTNDAEQHAVIVQIPHRMALGFDESIDELCEVLKNRLKESGTGEFDGKEEVPKFVELYAYGPDAKAMFEVIESHIRLSRFSKGAMALLRFGEGLLEPADTHRIFL